MKYYLVLFFFFLFSLPSLGADWVEVGEGAYIDKSTIETFYQGNKKYVLAWVMHKNRGNLMPIKNQEISYVLSKQYQYCWNKKSGIISSISYGVKGQYIESISLKQPLVTDIVPGSVGESVWSYLCE